MHKTKEMARKPMKERLLEAEHLVAQGRRRVERQRKIVETQRRRKISTRDAEATLNMLERSLLVFEQTLAAILAEEDGKVADLTSKTRASQLSNSGVIRGKYPGSHVRRSRWNAGLRDAMPLRRQRP